MSKLVLFQQAADPSVPAAGRIHLYAKTDDRIYWQEDDGEVHKILQEGDGIASLGNMTSAELAAKITDETGTGVLVFGTTPTLATPNFTGQVTFPTTGSGAGLLIGGDTQIYRSAADVITIPDTLVVSGSGGIAVPSGTVIRFDGGINTGIYESTSDVLSIFTDNVDRVTISNSGAAVTGSISSTSTASFGGNTSVTGQLSVNRTPGSGPIAFLTRGSAGADPVWNTTDVAVIENVAGTSATLQIFSSTSSNLAFSNPSVRNRGAITYSHATDVMRFTSASSTGEFSLTSAGQLAIPTTGSGAGILIGGDTQLYRSAADVLRTPDSFTVDGIVSSDTANSIGVLSATGVRVLANSTYGGAFGGRGSTYDATLFDRNTDARIGITTSGATVTGTLSATGNAAIGGSLSGGTGWAGLTSAGSVDFGFGGSIASYSASGQVSSYLASGVYYGSGWKYKTSGEGAVLVLGSGYSFNTVASGTAGNAASLVHAMSLTSAGRLILNNSGTDDGVNALQVAGSATVSSKLAVGGAPTTYPFTVRVATNVNASILNQSGTASFEGFNDAVNAYVPIQFSASELKYLIAGAEKARITADGYFKASNDGTYISSTGAYHELRSDGVGGAIIQFSNTHASAPYGLYVKFTASPDNNSQYAFLFEDGTTTRSAHYSDGDWYNHDGTYGTISDEYFKQDIKPVNSQWEDVKRIELYKYRNKDDIAAYGDKAVWMLGASYQGLLRTGNAGLTRGFQQGYFKGGAVDDMTMLKKAMVALQEAQQRIEFLEQHLGIVPPSFKPPFTYQAQPTVH